MVFTPDMSFIPESPEERAHCYRVLDENGQPVKHSNFVPVISLVLQATVSVSAKEEETLLYLFHFTILASMLRTY